jgi:hypothetical protein
MSSSAFRLPLLFQGVVGSVGDRSTPGRSGEPTRVTESCLGNVEPPGDAVRCGLGEGGKDSSLGDGGLKIAWSGVDGGLLYVTARCRDEIGTAAGTLVVAIGSPAMGTCSCSCCSALAGYKALPWVSSRGYKLRSTAPPDDAQ